MPTPGGSKLSSVDVGRLRTVAPVIPGVETRQRAVQPLVELRVPFELSREAIDDVDRGSEDSNWQPVKTAVETLGAADEGYPVSAHLSKALGKKGVVAFAPALDGAIVVSMRGGDYTLTLGEDVRIGYLSHDAETVELYVQETVTFRVNTDEASVVITN